MSMYVYTGKRVAILPKIIIKNYTSLRHCESDRFASHGLNSHIWLQKQYKNSW